MRSRGFSTIELLVAMAVLAITLSSAALVAFSSHAFAADTPASAAALEYVRELLQSEEALGKEDFALVVPTSTAQTIGAVTYSGRIDVSSLDLYSKQVTASVSWIGSYGRAQSISLPTIIVDPALSSADSCNASLSGDWRTLHIQNAITNFAQLVGDPSGVYKLTDVAAYQGKLYVTQNNSSTSSNTFFIFDIANPSAPPLMGALDNDPNNQTGLVAVAIASSSAGMYAYVASALTSEQLQVIDISNPFSPRIIASYKIPTNQAPNAGAGVSIAYSDGYVYLGTAKEFNVIDVSNPAHPAWVGGYVVGAKVNSMYIRGSYAYVAIPGANNLLALDISDPTNPTLADALTLPGGSTGEAVAGVGDMVYVGRTNGGDELYAVNTAEPAALLTEGAADLGTSTSNNVQSILVRQGIAFVLTNAQLAMVNVADPLHLAAYGSSLALPVGFGSGTALTCDGNVLYALSNAAAGGYLSAISP